MAAFTTNYGFDVPTSSDLVKNGATQIALLGQDLDTFLFRPFTKNAIINGACEVAQRGTSAVTLTAASFLYPVDRMFVGRSSGTTGATAQQIGSTTLTGFNNAVRVQRTAANTSTNDLFIGQSMESLNSIPFAGQTVTLSFYARAGANYSSSGSALAVRLYSGTGTDQSGLGSGFTGTATPISSSQVITTSWVRYSFSAAISSSATQLQFLAFYTPVGTAGAADNVDITGIQLEVGSQATPFTRAGGTIQGELAACQRYYERITSQSSNARLGAGIASGLTAFNPTIYFAVTKRVAASTIDFANLTTYDSAIRSFTTITYSEGSLNSTTINVTGVTSGLTTGRTTELIASTIGGYIGFSAEL
jgi:hypothetical protein